MNELRPFQFHLSTCLVMMLVAGLALVPAFLHGHVGHVFVAAFLILAAAIVCEGWIARGHRHTHG